MVQQPLKVVQNFQKEMPCNIEAEQAVIASILVSNEIYDEISPILDSQKFFDPIHVKIYETIEKLISKGLDLIVANDVSKQDIGFDSDFNEVNVYTKESKKYFEKSSKSLLAIKLINLLDQDSQPFH